MDKLPIYMDYMATTPIDPKVIEKMLLYMGPTIHFGNPASQTHVYGQVAAAAVEKAREQIASVIHAKSEEIIFTSGATEADNLAILGSARFYQRKGRHVITMATEHKAVLDSFKQLEKEGFEVTYLQPASDGLLNISSLEQALRVDTILVSIMHVNNEIGVIQDIDQIGKLLKGKGIIFHVDAAQSAGKLAIDLSRLNVSLMSFSAHKNYGPKGVGALYVRKQPRIRIQPLSFGGGHEGGLRSGTLATHQIVGMGEAFMLSESIRVEEQTKILKLRHRLWDGVKDLPDIQVNGSLDQRIAGNLNLCFKNIDSDSLLTALSGLAISTTSACSSGRSESSHVLKALGLSEELSRNSIRISFGRFTTEDELTEAITLLHAAAAELLARKK